ncbi:MAG: hypothetical protein L6Q99_00595 [Planctomycetes bacterium]|nr:hypothetical protein [Planctomycetota bacterium]
MSRSIRFALLAPCVLATTLASPALAHTWIVDASGGGDFLDLPPAIAAATSGDVLLVMPGRYSGFTLDEQLVILGQGPTVAVTGPVLVDSVPPGALAVLAELSLTQSCTLNACSGPVVLDSLSIAESLGVTDCTDVRVTRCALDGRPGSGGAGGFEAVRVSNSRIEFGECALNGGIGADGLSTAPGGDGGPALLLWDTTASAHVYRSHLTGGDGGDSSPFFPGWGGNGGDGVLNDCGSIPPCGFVLLAGSLEHVITGGVGGSAYDPGSNGAGVRSNGELRHSGVTISSIVSTGQVTNPTPPDPTLHVLAPAVAGQVTTFRVHAEPGAQVELLLGRKPTIVDVPGLVEDLLVVKNRTFQLGVVGPSGVVGFNFPVPAGFAKGFTFFAQAKVTFPSGEPRYSNSVPLVVR